MGAVKDILTFSPIGSILKSQKERAKRQGFAKGAESVKPQLDTARRTAEDETLRRKRLFQSDIGQQQQLATGRKTLLGQ
jgi:hypothetical protein